MIRLGRKWDYRTGRAGELVTFDPERDGHFLLLAPPGSGKGVSLEIPNLLLEMRDCSVLSIDPSGQNAAVCAEARRRIGNDVLCLNPYGLHVGRYGDLQSVGFNPLAGIDPRSRLFLQDCQAVGEALIKLDGNSQPHFPQSARGLVTGLIMWEVLKSFRERRAPLLENVRSMLCEPEAKDGEGLLTAGLRFHAAQMIAIGHRQISDLAGRFIKEGSREIDSVISTARTQTEWLLSEPMCSDLRQNGIGDWARLLDRPTTVFVIVPAEFLESQEGSVWLRLVILAGLRALYARAGRRAVQTVMLMLSEFAQLGKVDGNRNRAKPRPQIRRAPVAGAARHAPASRSLRPARSRKFCRAMRRNFRLCARRLGKCRVDVAPLRRRRCQGAGPQPRANTARQLVIRSSVNGAGRPKKF